MKKKFVLRLSKPRFSQFSQVQKKTRPRAMQVYLALLSWLNKQDSLSLGVEYIGSRADGQLCWHKDLKHFISRWTGLKHRQIQRYLRGFEDKGLIYTDDKQLWVDGKVRKQYFLNPLSDLRAKPGEKYLMLNMRECGQRGFDIYGHIETAMLEDSHPGHPDQLKFTVPRSTKWYRKQPKLYKPKLEKRSRPQRTVFKPRIRKMTPKEYQNPFPFYRMENKTTHSAQKSTKIYQKQLCLKQNNRRIWVHWWKTKRADSEYIKNRAGLAYSDRALWHCGKLYRQTDSPYVYELVARPRRAYKPIPDYGPSIPSVGQTRQVIADSLGLSLPEYLDKLRA